MFTMSDLKKFIQKRKHVRQLVTRLYNSKDSFPNLSEPEKVVNKSSLDYYLSELKELNKEIQDIQWELDETTDKKYEEELENCEDYGRKIRECYSLLVGRTNSTSHNSYEAARSLLKSPIAPLPRFSGLDEEDLLAFFREFEETTSKYNYPDYDKLLLLKQQVSGRALVLVNSLEADRQGYSHAKNLLVAAFASNDTLKFKVIRQLTELKLTQGKDPYEYMAQMRLLTESFSKLKIDVDYILQYFFWSGLNDIFQNKMIQITNHTKPSLKEINERFFDTCERYSEHLVVQPKLEKICLSSVNNSEDASSLAANVTIQSSLRKPQNNFKPCSICTNLFSREADHPMYRCIKYDNAEAKVTQLTKMNACLKCGNLNHRTDTCRYRFTSRCKKCSQWHFSFLCVKSVATEEVPSKFTNKKINKNENNKKETSSSMGTVTQALRGATGGDSVLTTFTCYLGECRVRALKDSGCQSNFVTNRFASDNKLSVVKEGVDLTLNGINVSKQYKSKVVEFTLKFGSTERKLTAMTLPSLNINLNLPGLSKITKTFVDKGFQLADNYLLEGNDRISDIDFILGSKSSYCVPETDVLFGRENMSVYSLTPLGVMLKGDINQLLTDVDLLIPTLVGTNIKSTDSLSPSEIAENIDVKCNSYISSVSIFGGHCHSFVSSYTLPEDFSYQNKYSILDSKGKIRDKELSRATSDILEGKCAYYTNYDKQVYDEETSEVNDKLINFAINNSNRDSDGRLVMPLLWNFKASHLLGSNRHLATIILKSTLKKLKKTENHLKLVDETFREQEDLGIIERISNLDEFLKIHPNHSFLAHMPVFKLDRKTTKCRIVFLSNLCETSKKGFSVSHNQAIHSGPSLNQKITSSLLHLRFGSHLLCFDIQKAFNNIVLPETDQNRLLFLWFRNVSRNDFSVVCYKNVRLSFGLRCSPTLLLLALYRILIMDSENDSERLKQLKRLIYQLAYMDNCAVSSDTEQELRWAYEQLQSIFEPYKFGLQQFVTNDSVLQAQVDEKENCTTAESTKLLGIKWNRASDTLSTHPINLNSNANTKRSILSSIASQFDLYNFNGPLMNRSRLFLHELQCRKDLDWDQVLSPALCKQWRNIAKQANAAPVLEVPRFVGSRKDEYCLTAYSDSSKAIFGTVIFITNLRTNSTNFVLAKNRLINKQLESKSIPSLELQGICLAAECLIDLYLELTGKTCVEPIKISHLKIFTDSMVSISWLDSYSNKLAKMQKRSVFVMNRLNCIHELCNKFPITFSYIAGMDNPADAITRAMSYKQLCRTNYLSARLPSRDDLQHLDIPDVVIPNPNTALSGSGNVVFLSGSEILDKSEHSQLLERCSSFRKVLNTYKYSLIYINNLKRIVRRKHPDKFGHLIVKDSTYDFFSEATKRAIMYEQNIHFSNIKDYFSCPANLSCVPNLISQLNLIVDKEGIIRVKHKLRNPLKLDRNFPILLPKQSRLTTLAILDLHTKLAHAGCYSVLSELRKRFYVTHCFSVVKKTLRSCVPCKVFKERTIKLNQNEYREFRQNPPSVPFKYIFIDHFGPYLTKRGEEKTKVWILCITCMWSRAINLKICHDMSVKEFLRSFQLHIYDHGLPELCISDLGTSLVAGGNVIVDFVKDPETMSFFSENSIKPIEFKHFDKGCSQMGSMVEICVKMCKRLIFGAIGKNVLDDREFEFIISMTVHLVNRRPISFKEALRDGSVDVPQPITPEMLIRGYDLPSINIIPELQPALDSDETWLPPGDPSQSIRRSYSKLRNVRSKLIDLYHDEFLATLCNQATDRKNRYKTVTHNKITPGDIVALKEVHTKPTNYPLAIVKDVTVNSLGEVTGAAVLKGKTREVVKRHSSTLIPILHANVSENLNVATPVSDAELISSRPETRRAAVIARELTRAQLN